MADFGYDWRGSLRFGHELQPRTRLEDGAIAKAVEERPVNGSEIDLVKFHQKQNPLTTEEHEGVSALDFILAGATTSLSCKPLTNKCLRTFWRPLVASRDLDG